MSFEEGNVPSRSYLKPSLPNTCSGHNTSACINLVFVALYDINIINESRVCFVEICSKRGEPFSIYSNILKRLAVSYKLL